MDEIEKIILENSNNGKIIDEDIKLIFSILNDLYSSENYLKSVKELNVPSNINASYSTTEKCIYINYNVMLSYIAKIIDDMSIESYNDKLLSLNIYLLQILLHEFEHVIQSKKINTNDNMESKILYNSSALEQSLKSNGTYNHYLYQLNPIEIEAKFNSINTIMKLNILTSLQSLYSLFSNKKLHLCTQNYFNNNGTIIFPSYIFFNCDQQYQEFLKYLNAMEIEKYKLDQRLSLGLKVSSSEFKELESTAKIKKI